MAAKNLADTLQALRKKIEELEKVILAPHTPPDHTSKLKLQRQVLLGVANFSEDPRAEEIKFD